MFKSFHVYARHGDVLVFHEVYSDPVEAQEHFAAAKKCGLAVSCFGRRSNRQGSVLLCYHHPDAGKQATSAALKSSRRGMRLRRLKARAEGGQK